MIPLEPVLRQRLDIKEGYNPCLRMVIPQPRGIVRIKIQSAVFDSPPDYLEFLKSRSSYLSLLIGSAEFKSATKMRTKSPEFNLLCEIPVEITTDMKLETILVDDILGADNVIGRSWESLDCVEQTCLGIPLVYFTIKNKIKLYPN